MLAICEECSKKYNVDETRIKGERARFSCFECGHIIVVIKPKNLTGDEPTVVLEGTDITPSL